MATKRKTTTKPEPRLPALLCKARRDAGKSQKAVGEALGGVLQSSVSGWERGKTVPSVEHLILLGRLYEVDYLAFVEAAAFDLEAGS